MENHEAECQRCGGGPRGLYGRCTRCIGMSDVEAAKAKAEHARRLALLAQDSWAHPDERCEFGCWECWECVA